MNGSHDAIGKCHKAMGEYHDALAALHKEMGHHHAEMEDCFGKLADGADSGDGDGKDGEKAAKSAPWLSLRASPADTASTQLAKLTAETETLKADLQKATDALRQVNEQLTKLLAEPRSPKAVAKSVAISKDDDAAGTAKGAEKKGLEMLKAIHRGDVG